MTVEAIVPLRLSGSPSGAPVRYLRLEDALNALGRQEFAAEWGRLPGWSQMPFRWRPKLRRYARHELRLFGQRARLRNLPVTLDLTKAERMACIRLYQQVREVLREALEQKKLDAFAMHYGTGESSPITAPCIWRKQAFPIFFTGRTVIREPDKADRLADVVFERKPFEQWLKNRAKAQAKKVSVKMLEAASAVIAEHRRHHAYEISRGEAKALVSASAREHGRDVSDRQFGACVWKGLGASAGRRETAQRVRFKEYEADLKIRLLAVFGGASGA